MSKYIVTANGTQNITGCQAFRPENVMNIIIVRNQEEANDLYYNYTEQKINSTNTHYSTLNESILTKYWVFQYSGRQSVISLPEETKYVI
jgi:hypothetical protein